MDNIFLAKTPPLQSSLTLQFLTATRGRKKKYQKRKTSSSVRALSKLLLSQALEKIGSICPGRHMILISRLASCWYCHSYWWYGTLREMEYPSETYRAEVYFWRGIGETRNQEKARACDTRMASKRYPRARRALFSRPNFITDDGTNPSQALCLSPTWTKMKKAASRSNAKSSVA